MSIPLQFKESQKYNKISIHSEKLEQHTIAVLYIHMIASHLLNS